MFVELRGDHLSKLQITVSDWLYLQVFECGHRHTTRFAAQGRSSFDQPVFFRMNATSVCVSYKNKIVHTISRSPIEFFLDNMDTIENTRIQQTLAIIAIVVLQEEKSLEKSEAYPNCPGFIHCHSVVPFPPNRVKPVFIPMVLDP